MISVVIPTFNEAGAIEETLRRAAAALGGAGEDFELIVVDDASADGTADHALALAREIPVRVLLRPARMGLATAVLDSWASARGDILGVMDGDLQHPPEVLAALAQAIRKEGADLAIGSRYVPGGGTTDWTWWRRMISRVATHLAATVLPLKLAAVGDPMSGLFLVRASAVCDADLEPLGYKILLEVLAKAHYRTVVEVPYIFQERGRGSSKLGPRQYLEYLRHLVRLTVGTGQLFGWLRYGFVGLAGAVIDVGLFYIFAQRLAWSPMAALATAIPLAFLSNFLWNEVFTFRPRKSKAGNLTRRLARYIWVCIPGAVINLIVTLLLITRGAGLITGAAFGAVSGGLYNLLFNIPAIWRTWGNPAGSGFPVGGSNN